MSCLEYAAKDPVEIINYGASFARLLGVGETIATAVFTSTVETSAGVETTPLAMVGVADISGDPIVRQRISGGTTGFTYRVKVTVTTSASQTLIGYVLLPIGPCC
jgi:hypothetical protein